MFFQPPYSYDDPRILYDEVCMFFDGAFDQVCLLNKFQTNIVGGSSSRTSSTKKTTTQIEKDQNEFINIFIECELIKYNEKQYNVDDDKKWTRFTGENNKNSNVEVKDIKISLSEPVVKGEYINLIKELTTSASYEGNKLKLDNSQNSNIKIEYIEPFENIKIKTDFVELKIKKENE